MLELTKLVRPQFSNFFISTTATLGLILFFWLLFYSITCLGCPLPAPEITRFYDLGFFSFSSFSFIIFLTMIPLQRAEEKLSPGFYSRILHTPWSHFGLYVLFFSSVACFVAIAVHKEFKVEQYLHPLFFALIASIVSAIIFHRFWVLCNLYQPYVVYSNISQLTKEEGIQDAWLELLECTYKTISDKRISDAKNFMLLLGNLYCKVKKKEDLKHMEEDLENLYQFSNQLRHIHRQMERQWPFLTLADKGDDTSNKQQQTTLPAEDPVYLGLATDGQN